MTFTSQIIPEQNPKPLCIITILMVKNQQMVELMAANKEETDDQLTHEWEPESPKLHHSHPNNL